jgi:dienelactone hydrolase
MKMIQVLFLSALLHSASAASAAGLAPPDDPAHPGSKTYGYEFVESNLICQGRTVSMFVPRGSLVNQRFPVVVFGHGQSLEIKHYRATFEHLARKGVAVLFPVYDKGFFDQDWSRMGDDYARLADCAVAQDWRLDEGKVIYSGHSKGAYIAQIAAGKAAQGRIRSVPRAVVLFEPAGADAATLAQMDPASTLTVVYADHDSVVKREYSERIFQEAASRRKQFIFMRSYKGFGMDLQADHFWPLSAKFMLVGGDEGPFHYFGSWKWLVGAAQDLQQGDRGDNRYVYGDLAADKGAPGFSDDIRKNW